MGSDKALLEIEGSPIALRIAHEIGQVCDSVTLVGDPARYGALGLNVTPDNFPGEGPLAGIEAALRSTSSDWNLVVACDMPALRAPVFEAIVEAAFAATGDAVVPRYEDGRVEPLCAVYHRRCHPLVFRALAAGVRRATDALQLLELTYFTVRDPLDTPKSPGLTREHFVNLNTPEDLRKYRDA